MGQEWWGVGGGFQDLNGKSEFKTVSDFFLNWVATFCRYQRADYILLYEFDVLVFEILLQYFENISS